MPDRDVAPKSTREVSIRRIAIVVLVICGIALVVWLRTLGLALAGVFAVLIYLLEVNQPSQREVEALKSSVRASAAEIEDILDEFHDFLTSPDAERLADRTLHRPDLANANSVDPDIERFYYQVSMTKRFLNRLSARLEQRLTAAQVNTLLTITDQRQLELQEAWVAARRAAYRRGIGQTD